MSWHPKLKTFFILFLVVYFYTLNFDQINKHLKQNWIPNETKHKRLTYSQLFFDHFLGHNFW